MSKKYYFAARPETLVSVVRVGKLRENLPAYATKNGSMIFFAEVRNALLASKGLPNAHANQTFIVEIQPPSLYETNLIVHQYDKDHNISSLSAEHIEIDWITAIYVYSQSGYNLSTRLLNNESPVDIVVNPHIFGDLLPIRRSRSLSQQLSFFSASEINRDQPNITYVRRGDLLGSNMQTLVNTVNTVGVMGKGIALLFKQQYPQMFADYKVRCQNKEVKVGEPYLFKETDERWVLNFPTKQHWRHPSKLEYIEDGLRYLAEHVQEWGITSLAVPPLGCGNGQLNWDAVRPIIEKYLYSLSMPIEIYVPFIKSEKKQSNKRRCSSSEPESRKKPCQDDEGIGEHLSFNK